MPVQQPVLFVPHGAPTFALNPAGAGAALVQTARRLTRPRAILMVSAHWDTEVPVVGNGQQLETIHDYWGFPDALYSIDYPAGSDAAVAEEVHGLLARSGFEPRLDGERGLDHGAWIPLRIMFPEADVPVIPLSIQSHLGPEYHFLLGRALAPLLEENILIVASGNLTHNLRDFQMAYRDGSGTPAYVSQFAEWMWERVAARDTTSVIGYRHQAPAATRAHPSEDHLLPLHVALGAAGPGYRAERLYAGLDSIVLAMDSYGLWPAEQRAA